MDNSMKALILLGVIAYIIWPVDVMLGPVDDALVFAMGMAARRAITD